MVDEFVKWLHKVKTLTVAIAAVFVSVLCGLMIWTFWLNQPQTHEDVQKAALVELSELKGWAGEELARKEFEQLKGQFVPFVIRDAATGEIVVSLDKRAVLWDATIQVTGQHLPAYRQEIGDCVSMGAAAAVDYLQCVQIVLGSPHQYRPAFQPYIYGISRVQIGKGQLGCNSDGSLGSWAALGVQKYGVLFADHEGVPSYSGSVAKKWGCKPGPPEKFVNYAQQFSVKSAANVTTWQEVRDALVNGYPVTIASNVGFQMRGTVSNNKLWLRQTGNWAHQMCVIGYDPSPEPCFCILNSWGANAHGKQPDGPDGSFWVTAKVMQKIVSQGDSFAFSSFEGFRRQRWDIILQKGDKDVDAGRIGLRERVADYALAL